MRNLLFNFKCWKWTCSLNWISFLNQVLLHFHCLCSENVCYHTPELISFFFFLTGGLTSSCQTSQTPVGFPQLWQFPSPRPWEQPWWGEAVCSVYSSSKQPRHHGWESGQSNDRVISVYLLKHSQSDQSETHRMDKSLQEVFAEQSQGHGFRKELHIRSSLQMKQQEERIHLSRMSC